MWIALAIVFVLWVALNMKSSRTDGHYLAKVHPYRKMMPYIMAGRNESIVFYDDYLNADNLLEYLEKAEKNFHCDITHALVAAAGIGLGQNPTMNHFVAGRRLYHRKRREVTFSMKRKKLNRKAKLTAVKMDMADGETFRELCERIGGKIGVERTDKKTYLDKELNLFMKVPRPVLNIAVKLLKWLDYYNILPYEFIKNDGMYTSMFIANLGSLGMRAGFHHLYEWGNCPLFLMVGRIEDQPVVVDGEIVIRKTMHMRWSYDERIDDGQASGAGMASVRQVLENPTKYFGCLDPDGSDATPMPYEPI
jgi:hypothetical protein